MSLENFCRKPLIKVSPDMSITKACRLMEQNNIGCLVAEKDGELCGISLTETSHCELPAPKKTRARRS
jgi:predicted transcriptional regulator